MPEFDLADYELEFAADPVLIELSSQLGSNVVPRVALSPTQTSESLQDTVSFSALAERMTKAEINVFSEEYYRIPLGLGERGAILEFLVSPYQVKLAHKPREMLRITVSSKAFDENTATPMTVVDDYLIDYARQQVYAFGGDISGVAGDGDTINDVLWGVTVSSPPHTEYSAPNKKTDTVFNSAYEQEVIAAIEASKTHDGTASLFSRLAWLIDAPKEPVQQFARSHPQ